VRAGSLRALAVTGAQRSPSLPDVPTIAESGTPGYRFAGWTGLAVPAATPRAIVERLHGEIAKIAAATRPSNGSPPPDRKPASCRRRSSPTSSASSTRGSAS
jgi:hypothetical protein